MVNYLAKVQVIVDNNGKPKKVTEQYLVNAVSVTDAESKVNTEFKNSPLEFEVKSISETKILKVLN